MFGFPKYLTKSRILLLLMAVVVAWFGHKLYVGDINLSANTFSKVFEPMTASDVKSAPASVNAPTLIETDSPAASAVNVSKEGSNARVDTVQPSELLPADVNSKWASENNLSTLSGMRMPDLLTPQFMAGENTVGQSRKNPNLQLRADPPIPRVENVLWNQPIIEPDTVRVNLDIGRSR